MEFPIRINKYLADNGLSTRRGADVLILAGKVTVNDDRAVIGQQIQSDDIVVVKDNSKRSYRYLLYYKPRGVITHSPSERETDIATQIAHDHGVKDLFPVGRLDKDSEGLIMLTNDGRITKRLLEPQYDHEKEYHVIVDKKVTDAFLNKLARGVNIEGYLTKPARAERDRLNEFAFTLNLTEGKKHQIRRMCAALGYQVIHLKRTAILDMKLRPLKEGAYRALNERERKKLGTTLKLNLG